MFVISIDRFKRLRSPPINTFIINLAFSDMSASILHSMSAYSNFNGRWAFGRVGCQFYAMGITCFGLVSILTFSAIAFERCLVIAGPATHPSVGLADGHKKVSRSQAQKVCAFIWLHCAILVSMPLLGWSSYVPEGLLTSCSWDYTTRSASNRSYYILLVITGFFLPLMLICVSYGRIMASVMWRARQMASANPQSSAFRKLRRQTEMKTAQIVVTLILVYLTAWTPYAIVTLIGQFGSEDSQLSPMATAIPAYFAKTAVVMDPLVYGFSHPHFRTSMRHFMANLADVTRIKKAKTSSTIRYDHDGNAVSQQPGGFNNKSWPGSRQTNRNSCDSSYQSRGMTVYPSASCRTLQQCEKVNNQRRMLRTFRDLSAHDNSKIKTAKWPPANNADSQLCANKSVAVVFSIATAEVKTINQHKDMWDDQDAVAIVNAAANSCKYKVRNKSECVEEPSMLSHQIVVEPLKANR